MPRLRKPLVFLLRLGVTLGVIAWIFSGVDWKDLGEAVLRMSPGWIAGAVACFGVVMVLVAWRWQGLLAVQGLQLPYKEALAVSFIGQFFNAFLLGTTGGDVAKIYYAARWSPGRRTPAILSVLVDRAMGLLSLLAIAVVLGVLRYSTLVRTHATAAALNVAFLMGAATAGAAVLVWTLPWLRAAFKKRGWWERLPGHQYLEKIHDAWLKYDRAPGAVLWAGALSLVLNGFTMALFACILEAMGLRLPLWEWIASIAIVQLVASLPISLSGLGPREGLTILFLGLFGVRAEQALAFSLVGFAVTLFWSLVGGIVYLYYRRASAGVSENAAAAAALASPDPAQLEAAATGIVRRLQEAGHTAYFAGGCVRDRLLGNPAKDFDVATSARPEQVQALFRRVTGLEGKVFGVVRVIERGQAIEVATFRTDWEYKDGRRPEGVTFATDREDAARRDFTVNGMFYDPIAGRIIDYVEGQKDLAAKLIRAIGDPQARFAEDKLRLLRAVRFAVNLNFEIEPATWCALCAHASDIRQVSVERIREELDKIWTGPDPARGLDLLDQSGLLRVVLSELDAMHGVEQPPQFHPEGDVYQHVRLMLSYLKNAPLELALSVLFHDVGKPRTFKVDETGRIRFNEHETVGARMAEGILKRLRYSNEVIDAVVACVANHMTFKDAPQMRLSTLKKLMARPTYPIELELHRIDCLGCHGDLSIYNYLVEKQAAMPPEAIRPPRLVTGDDLLKMGVPFGPQVGKLLSALTDEQLEGRIQTREEALAFVRERWAQISSVASKTH